MLEGDCAFTYAYPFRFLYWEKGVPAKTLAAFQGDKLSTSFYLCKSQPISPLRTAIEVSLLSENL